MPENEKTMSPLEAFRDRFEQSSRSRLKGILERYKHRLAPAERAAYEGWIEASPSGNLMPLRRRLLDRLLRGAALRRRSDRSWEGLATLESSPRGPYNDRAALEESLRRFASADPQWTREFLDLYEGMDKIRAACETLLPQAAKRG